MIRSCRKGDARAWKRVVEKYERLVYSIPLNYGLSHEDAADVMQTTFTILIKSFHTLSDDSPLGSWLATVARRHTWRLLDRKRREDTSEYEIGQEIGVDVLEAGVHPRVHVASQGVGHRTALPDGALEALGVDARDAAPDVELYA